MKINGVIMTAGEMARKGLKCCANCNKRHKCPSSTKDTGLIECKGHRFDKSFF